ncbi:unnamed protein product [Rangifer tarandus platyrhynchus]|uniref:Uncharacterized protein n=2 Tax=Rangifer tarandus platyrhynchus TaxID=3082113 RepID=A0ACB0F3U8_RANTA|nr:unnamed protein product [Rangifer tarandus platyrhynchus]CAI9707606.1 unnamed protein product [Rangifer tarandus platyrhynchus]
MVMSDLRPRSPRRAELWLAPRVSQGNLNSDELPQCSGAWRPAADGWHSGYHKVTGAAAARRGRGRRALGALGGKVGSKRTPEKCRTEGHVFGRAWPPASQLWSPEGDGHPPALPGAWPPLIVGRGPRPRKALTSAGLRARRSAELPAGSPQVQHPAKGGWQSQQLEPRDAVSWSLPKRQTDVLQTPAAGRSCLSAGVMVGSEEQGGARFVDRGSLQCARVLSLRAHLLARPRLSVPSALGGQRGHRRWTCAELRERCPHPHPRTATPGRAGLLPPRCASPLRCFRE